MPIGGMNTGRDISLVIIDPITGQNVQFPLPTGFTNEPVYSTLKHTALSSPPETYDAPDGWKGTIDYDREDVSIDEFFDNLETSYWNGQNYFTGSITQTITEKDGSTTQWQFTKVSFRFEDAGKWKGQDMVKIRIGWTASQRKRIK